MTGAISAFVQRTALTIGPGSVAQLTDAQTELEMRRPVVLLDRNLIETPVDEAVRKRLTNPHLVLTPAGEPSTDSVERCAGEILEHEPDGVVAVGGGTTLDTAKLARGLIASDSTPILALPDPLPRAPLPSIAIPTTAGTGSEAGADAIVTDPSARGKELVKVPALAASRAIADSELTLGLPAHQTACSGMDALAQGVFAYVAAGGDESIAGQLALAGIRRIWRWLPAAVTSGDDRRAREQMMLGSITNAVAMFNAPYDYAAEHLFAEAVGVAFGMPHGHTVAAFAAPVAEYNCRHLAAEYGRLGRQLGVADASAADEEAALAFVDGLRDLVNGIGVEPLRGPGGDELRAWTREVAIEGAFAPNPRPVSPDDAVRIISAGFASGFELADDGAAT